MGYRFGMKRRGFLLGIFVALLGVASTDNKAGPPRSPDLEGGQLEKLVLKTPAIRCQGCIGDIQRALKRIKGWLPLPK